MRASSLILSLALSVIGCSAGDERPETIDASCADGLCKFDEVGSMQLALNATCTLQQASTSSPVFGCCYSQDTCYVGSATWHCGFNSLFGPAICTYGNSLLTLNSLVDGNSTWRQASCVRFTLPNSQYFTGLDYPCYLGEKLRYPESPGSFVPGGQPGPDTQRKRIVKGRPNQGWKAFLTRTWASPYGCYPTVEILPSSECN